MNRRAISVVTALDLLYGLPLPYVQDAPNSSGKGWFMRLEPEHPTEPHRAYPGVYSTSFAIQLLCRQRDPTADPSRSEIQLGMEYLVNQFADSKRIDAGERPDCKQTRKLQEVGHHDFILTLKLCAVLQASNAIAKIIHMHAQFADLLQRHANTLDEIASRLEHIAVRDASGQRVELAWPWHAGGEADTIPSCEVLLTLTDNSIGSTHFLSDYQQTVGYLTSVLETRAASLLNKVYACKALLLVETRVNAKLIPHNLKCRIASELDDAMADISTVPWQEVMHFQVLSVDRSSISHYKPWIWTFPKIEFTQCFAGLSPRASRRTEFELAAQLVQNISRNDGKVVFLQSAPPTLLASLKTADLLFHFQQTALSTTLGAFSFARERVLMTTTAFLVRHRSVPVIVLFLCVLIALLPNRPTLGQGMVHTAPITRSLLILHDSTVQLLAVWPLLCLFFTALVMFNQGSFAARLRASVLNFILAVIIKVALGFIPTVR